MPFIHSLFCWSGRDNRARYATIIILCHFLFILFSALFHQSPFIQLFFAMSFAAVILYSTKRRLTDARLINSWVYIPAVTFFLSALLIAFLQVAAIFWFIVLPLLLSLILLTYPSTGRKLNYILGYAGPIDLSIYVEQHSFNQKQRVEPSVGTSISHHIDSDKIQDSPYSNPHRSNNQADIGELIRERLFGKNTKFTIIVFVGFLFVAITITFLLSEPVPHEQLKTEEAAYINESHNDISQRLSGVSMPDEFTLYLNQYSGVILHWQADSTSTNKVWDIKTSQSDKSCSVITFNNGKSIRTLNVIVENSDMYYAEFSPLDTANMIEHLVYRGKFDLCGYEFSLKGSQSALAKKPQYSQWLN